MSSWIWIAASLAAQASDPPSTLRLGEIEARLFYKETGRLSVDMLDRKTEFVPHNTVIGEGSAEEAADDILVTVDLRTTKVGEGERFVTAPVEIVVRDRAGKVVGKRSFESTLTSREGIEKKALWLNDAACAGELTITARYNGEVRRAKLVMGCGE